MNTALRLTIKQWATEDRPTERLQRLGAESLTDAELLAILIGSGTQQSAQWILATMCWASSTTARPLGRFACKEPQHIGQGSFR